MDVILHFTAKGTQKPYYTHIWLILSGISFVVRACIAPSISREAYPPEEKWYFRGEKSGFP